MTSLGLKLLHQFEPETAHGLSLLAVKLGLAPKPRRVESTLLRTEVFGLDFPNPVGLAAGYDKNAEVYNKMLGMGFGFVESGSITPQAQMGNDKPRLFRLTEDEAVINRMGFNNKGLEVAHENLHRNRPKGIVGINLGKNKTSSSTVDDYVMGVQHLAPYASYMVINVSSPNTPGLRALQQRGELENIVGSVLDALHDTCPDHRPPLLVKIAPDLVMNDLEQIALVATDMALDGLIVSNTTIYRPDNLQSPHRNETGGLSGKPIFEPSTRILRQMYHFTEGKVPLIGVGGISSAEDAYVKILCGASLVQVYSSLVYQGPKLVRDINLGLIDLLQKDGFKNVSEAVGIDAQKGYL